MTNITLKLALMFPLLISIENQFDLGSRNFRPAGGVNLVSTANNGCLSTTNSGSTMACTTTGNIGSLNTALVDMAWFGTQTLTGCSPSSGTFTQQGTTTAWYTGSTGQEAFGIVSGASAGSALTVTCTFSSSMNGTFPNLQIDVTQGSISAPVIDSLAAPATGTVNTATSGTVTTTNSGEFLWSIVDMSGNAIVGVSPQAMTRTQPTGASPFIIQIGTAVSAGSNYATATITGGGSGFWVAQLLAMK